MIWRYFTPRVASAIFIDMASRPKMMIHSAAPGPPIVIATATPAMLPRPTVPESSVASAWNDETSPGSVLRVNLPRMTLRECPSPVIGWKRRKTVRKIAPTMSQTTMSGNPTPKIGISKKTMNDSHSANGAKRPSMNWSTEEPDWSAAPARRAGGAIIFMLSGAW